MKPAKILIVDDTQDCRKLLALLLPSLLDAVDMIEAADGAEAIDILSKRSDFDLVISDYTMPNVTGAGVFRYLQEAKLEIPFILFTVLYDFETADFSGPTFMGSVQKHDIETLERLLVKAGLKPKQNSDASDSDSGLVPQFS